MKFLFAPWRMEYVSGSAESSGCIFCNAADGKDPMVFWRGHRVFALLNRYPYTSGHVMVAPFQHVADLEKLDPETAAELMEAARLMVAALRKAYRPHGFNVGMNLGEAAGAGIAAHLHLHIVPRWSGDTNFMSVLGEVRVLPESLEKTKERLVEAVNLIGGSSPQ